jgi:hypothetical protein
MMFMLCFSALAGALIMAAFSIGTGSLAMLLAMPLAASLCALLAGAALAMFAPREHIGSDDTCGTDELDLDTLADTLSQQLRSISFEPVTASAPDRAVKRSA